MTLTADESTATSTTSAPRSFIEVQLPVSKLSKESYKERKAGSGQTLTGLGKWWGRKPLILVRAALLGLLMPASDNPQRDREIYLKMLTMDEEGLWQRRTKSIPAARLYELAAVPELRGRGARHSHRSPLEKSREHWFETNAQGKVAWSPSIDRAQREAITRQIFDRLPYEQKLEFCVRPEELDGPSEAAWRDINAHLGTHASSLPDLVAELGTRRFGHVPRVGDAFCGGGSIPFEAARLGCDVHASDLNPVAALLTWGALNIVGGGPEVAKQVEEARSALFAAVDEQITAWGIEHNAQGWRADLYLYCYETTCPECGWKVPLSGSWVIGEKSGVVADLVPDPTTKTFRIDVREGASKDDLRRAKDGGTIKDGEMICPSSACAKKDVPTRIKVSVLRGDRREGGETVYGIRPWSETQVVAGPDDLYHERLYCIRWLVPTRNGKSARIYSAPDEADLAREQKAQSLLLERFDDWRARGILPTMAIRQGAETRRIRRDLGATYWHHLFNPRQLLVLGCTIDANRINTEKNRVNNTANLLTVGHQATVMSRLSRWDPGNEQDHPALFTQAFTTVYNFSCRSLAFFRSGALTPPPRDTSGSSEVQTLDARFVSSRTDLWLTDPPYADAINYHELCDFFLAWYSGSIRQLHTGWHDDGRHALAVVGKDEQFRQTMADVYKNLAHHMSNGGMQVVMFTHNDAGVWADLCMILWAAGLQVSAAWCIATETRNSAAHKEDGQYVQGTVLAVLRKRTSSETAFLDELYPMVDAEVKRQLDEMRSLDDARDPSFADADYQLAAYAAAMKVLTAYSSIEDIDVGRELARPRETGETSPIKALIEQTVTTACNHLIPEGVEPSTWRQLAPPERYYLKGLDLASRGEAKISAYQDLARGFGFADYKPIISLKANDARLFTASELGRKELGVGAFGASLVRHALFAVYSAVKAEDAREGRNWLKNEVPDYWNRRTLLIDILRCLGRLEDVLDHWRTDAAMARLIAGALENDHV